MTIEAGKYDRKTGKYDQISSFNLNKYSVFTGHDLKINTSKARFSRT